MFFFDHHYNYDNKVEIIYYYDCAWGSNIIYNVFTNFKTVVMSENGIEIQTIDNIRIIEDGVFGIK